MNNAKKIKFLNHWTIRLLPLLSVVQLISGCGNTGDLKKVVGIAATTGSTVIETSTALGSLLMIHGNNQTVAPGTPATQNLSVMAMDNSGKPKAGVEVTFKLLNTNLGSLSNSSETGLTYAVSTTSNDGTASISFTANNTVGSASVVASSTFGSAVFNIMIGTSTNSNSSGSIMLATNGNNQSVEKGMPASQPLEVLILNSQGIAVANAPVKFEIMSNGMGTLTGNAAIANATTQSNGRTSVNFTAASADGPVTVVASSSYGSIVFSLKVFTPGSVNSISSMAMIVEGNNQFVSLNGNASKQLEVMALSSLGNPIQGIEFNFEILSAGMGTLTGGSTSAPATTGSNGRASVGFTASSTAGPVSIIAKSSAGNVVFNLNVGSSSNTSASGSTLLTINGNNQAVLISSTATKDLEVLALDSFGTPIPNLTITFQIATTGSGTLTGGGTTATDTTDSDGKAKVAFHAGTQTGSATVIARSIAGSAAFNLNITTAPTPGYDGSMLLVTNGNNQAITQSTPAVKNLEVLALDKQGVPIQGLTINFEVATTGAGLLAGGSTTATRTTNASGKASIGFTAGSTLGPATVIATSLAGGTVFNLIINPASTTNSSSSLLLVTNGNNQNVILNSDAAKDLEVLAIDNKGVPIEGLLVTFSVATTGSGTLTGGSATATDTTDANGKAKVSFSAGSQTGSATVVATSTAGSAVFNLQISGAASTIAAGSILLVTGGNNQMIVKNTNAASSLEVMAINSAGLPISGMSIKFEVATAGAGTFAGGNTVSTTTTNGSGKASVNFSAGSTTQAATIVATSNAGSAVFNLVIVNSATNNSIGSTLLVTNGNNQTLVENATTGTSLEVMALNSAGAPISGMNVQFEIVTAGMGTLTGGSTTASATTDSNGKANIDFTANTLVGSATVIATSSAGSAVFNLKIINATTSSASGSVLLAINGNNQTLIKSQAADSDFEVLALNSFGTPMSGVTVTFKVATTGAGTFSNNSTTANVNTDVNGRATIGFTASTQLGAASIIATSNAGSTLFNFNVINAATPSTNTLGSALLITAGNNQVLEQNTAAPLDLEVMAVNSNGTSIQGISITLQVASGSFSGGGTTKTLITNSSGRASTGYTPGSQLGPLSVIATSSAGSNVFNLTVGTQGAGSTLSISGGNGQLLLPNSTASNQLEVIATNSTGAPLPNIPVTFTVTTTNGGVLSTNQLQYVTINTDSNGKAATTFKSSNYVGTVSILASSQIGSVTFSLNTNTVNSGSSGGGEILIFSPTTLAPASGTWLKTEKGSAPARTVTLTNAASTSVYLNSVFTTNQVPFKIVTEDCPKSPVPFASGSSCSITVQFTPQSSGTFSRALFVNWSALSDGSNGANAVLALEGSGPEPLVFAGLGQPTNTTTTSSQLNWVAATGGLVSSYQIWDTTNTATLLATLPPNSTFYPLSNLAPNSTTKYRAFAINSAGDQDGNTVEVQVTTGTTTGPSLTTVSNFVFPSNYIRASFDTLTANVNSSVTGTDTGPNGAITYTCKFSRTVTGTGTDKTTCATGTLGGIFNFDSPSGVLTWLPKFGTQGVYEFQISGDDGYGISSQFFTVNVAHPYGSETSLSSKNLSTIIADYRSSFAARTKQNATTATSWLNTLGNTYTASVIGTANFNGQSNPTTSDHLERFSFDGSTQLNLGSPLAGLNQFMIDYWISNPESTFTNNSTVLRMDSPSTDNGFIVKQTTMENGQRALRIDFDRSYSRVINADQPAGYWRLDETSGSNLSDSAGSNPLTIEDSSGTPTTTGVTHAIAGATKGETTSTAIQIHTNRFKFPNVSDFKPATSFSIEMWVRYPSRTTPVDHDLYTFNTANTASGISIRVVSGLLSVKYKPSNAATVELSGANSTINTYNLFDGNWHHLVFTSNATYKALYMNGIPIASSSANDGSISWPGNPENAFLASGGDSTNPIQIDEVAFYSRVIDVDVVKNHLAAGDHFIRNQALFPANAHMQTRPLGLWRFTDTQTNYISQDYSTNQQEVISIRSGVVSANMIRYTPGVYKRVGGSNIDQAGSTYLGASSGNSNMAQNNLINTNKLLFNKKFTFSAWKFFSTPVTSGNNSVFFNIDNNSTSEDIVGMNLYVSADGRMYSIFDWSRTNGSRATRSQVYSTNPVVPYSGGSIPNGWYHIAMTFDGDEAAANRVQYYVNGVPVKMTVGTGTLPTTLTTLTNPNTNSYELATWSIQGWPYYWVTQMGYAMMELAMHDRVLNANEIRAQAHEGSLRYCDIPLTTELTTPYRSRPFDYINMLFDGSNLTIRRNSKTECALRPVVNLGSEGMDLIFGSATNGFKGHITDVRIHGASSGTVATAKDTYVGFYNSSDQHRVSPIGGIVTTNLVKVFEPSSAMDGVRPYNPGYDVTKIQYDDIGYQINGIRQEPGILRGFDSTSGWFGDGTPTNPNRLTFDGINDWVDLGTSPMYNTNPSELTVCAWVKTTQDTTGTSATSGTAIFSKGYNTSWGDFNLGTYDSGLWIYLSNSASSTDWARGQSLYPTYRNNNWHYYCGVVNSTQYTNYLDGAIATGPTNRNTAGNLISNNDYHARAALGRSVDWQASGLGGGVFFKGDMGGVHIYNKALNQTQIKQNCAAQAGMYNVSTCVP